MSLLSKEFIDELCRSPNDFDCLPRSMQVQCFVELLREQGHTRFTAEELGDLFETGKMTSPRSGKTITCSPEKAHHC